MPKADKLIAPARANAVIGCSLFTMAPVHSIATLTSANSTNVGINTHDRCVFAVTTPAAKPAEFVKLCYVETVAGASVGQRKQLISDESCSTAAF
jgi:hypothetical protein